MHRALLECQLSDLYITNNIVMHYQCRSWYLL